MSIQSLVPFIFRVLLSSLFYGTVLAGVALALTWVFRRRTAPALAAAIWMVVMLKFLVPIAPAFPALSAPLRQAMPGATALAANALQLTDLKLASGGAVASPAMIAIGTLLGLWLLASLLLALRAVRRNLSLRSELAALPEAPEEIRAVVERHAKSLGVKAPRALVGSGSPFVTGLVRARLVLPEMQVGEALDAVVLHELAHLKRRDPWMRALQLLVQILFFFWPPLRFAMRRLEEAREQACDSIALERAAMPGRDYAQLLIEMHLKSSTGARSALAMASRVSQLEGRVDMIMENEIRRSTPLTALFVGAFALLAIAAGASADSKPNSDSEAKRGYSDGARDDVATQLLSSAVEKAAKHDFAGALLDINDCIRLKPEQSILAKCQRSAAVIEMQQGNKAAALEAFRAYLPNCNPNADCDKIKLLITKLSE